MLCPPGAAQISFFSISQHARSQFSGSPVAWPCTDETNSLWQRVHTSCCATGSLGTLILAKTNHLCVCVMVCFREFFIYSWTCMMWGAAIQNPECFIGMGKGAKMVCFWQWMNWRALQRSSVKPWIYLPHLSPRVCSDQGEDNLIIRQRALGSVWMFVCLSAFCDHVGLSTDNLYYTNNTSTPGDGFQADFKEI